MTPSNAYIAFEQADSALAVEQLPQFAQMGEQILSEISALVHQMAADQTAEPNQQRSSTEPTTTDRSSATLTALQALIQQLEGVFTQLPDVTHKLNRAHALLIAQREASMDGILVVDECDRIISINQRFCDFWQVPPELAQVKDDHKMLEYAVSQTANPEQFLAKVQHLYQHPQETSQDEVLLKDGRTGARYSAPVMSSGGEHFGRVWYFRDITQRKRHELALSQMNEALEAQVQERTQALQTGMQALKTTQTQLVQNEKMAALGNLVSGVAHEVNNPVGFITGNIKPALAYVEDLFSLLDLYREQMPNPHSAIASEIEDIDLEYIREDLPKLIGSIQSGAQRIKDISTSLRTFSRADTDTPVEFNIHDGIDSTLLILKHRLKANEIRAEIEIVKQYGHLPPIECYAGQLNQVFMNLLANAIDAIDEVDQTDARIEIQTALLEHLAQQHVQIKIRDNGVGMSEAIQQQVFEHLFTTKSVGKGTGLGLTIARQIIFDVHQGSIEVHSAPAQGTTFIITLPVKAQDVSS